MQTKEPKTRGEKGNRDLLVRKVKLTGITDIMFDRYSGDNDTQLQPHQKLYFSEDGRTIVLPSKNIISFLSAQNTDSAPRRILDKRKYKDFCNQCLAYVTINPRSIPFCKNGEEIKFGKFENDIDSESGVYLDRTVARLPKGIPNPKVRPVLPMPWELNFELSIYPNENLQEQQLLNVFEKGGLILGLGTFRGQYGKFKVTFWE